MVTVESLITICRNIKFERLENLKISGVSRFVEDLGFDSIDLVTMIVEIESTCSVSLLDKAEIMLSLKTINDVVNFLQEEL